MTVPHSLPRDAADLELIEGHDRHRRRGRKRKDQRPVHADAALDTRTQEEIEAAYERARRDSRAVRNDLGAGAEIEAAMEALDQI